MLTRDLPKRLLVFLTLSIPLLACDRQGPMEPQIESNLAVVEASDWDRIQARSRPFHGSTTGMLIGQSFPAPEGRCPAERPVLAEYQGAGKATHLGRFSVVGGECLYFDPTDPAALSTGEGRYRLTAAAGDWLDVAYDRATVGFEGPTSPWVLWSASVRVLEGTGRFEGAEFVGMTWSGGFNVLTQETYSNLDGRIAYDAPYRKHGRDWKGS